MKNQLNELQKSINYIFKDANLLKLALTHRSVGLANNERLEFLGDSILNFAVGSALYNKFPEVKEGDLSRMRSSLVKEATLAMIATRFDLGRYMLLGFGEKKNNGRNRVSILADAVEAIIGAIYLDSSETKVYSIVNEWFSDLLAEVTPGEKQKDSKTRLQEYLQSKKMNLPIYNILDIKGKDHNQVFYASCMIEELSITKEGSGSTRRIAEQNAAYLTLKEINII
ncbi:MAG: ribonuclease III [Psittacicella sp.]